MTIPGIVPQPDPAAFAEVCYVLPDKRLWWAKVYKGSDGWELRVNNSLAGTFKRSKAVIKWVYSRAKEKGITWGPEFDTLYKLKGRTAQSVVPDCHEPMSAEESTFGGRGLPECVACPYRSNCGEPSAQPKVDKDVVEPEEVFLTRLQAKLKAQWGGQ